MTLPQPCDLDGMQIGVTDAWKSFDVCLEPSSWTPSTVLTRSARGGLWSCPQEQGTELASKGAPPCSSLITSISKRAALCQSGVR